MFMLKKFVEELFLPISWVVLLVTAGLVLSAFRKNLKLGRVFIILGLGVLLVFSNPVIAHLLSVPLDYRYPPLLTAPREDIRFVVVLAGGYSPSDALPVSSQLSDSTVRRLVEGIRIYRMLPNSKLVLSGGTFPGFARPVAQLMAELAEALGVPRDRIVIEAVSLDTKQEARLVLPIVRQETFVLVTSASHMPRSVALFRTAGMHPIPAPVGQSVLSASPTRYLPSGTALKTCDATIHEYLGLLGSWAMGDR